MESKRSLDGAFVEPLRSRDKAFLESSMSLGGVLMEPSWSLHRVQVESAVISKLFSMAVLLFLFDVSPSLSVRFVDLMSRV